MNEKMLEQIQNVTSIVKEMQNSNVGGENDEKGGRLHFLEKTNQIANDHY